MDKSVKYSFRSKTAWFKHYEGITRHLGRISIATGMALMIALACVRPAFADEGGVGFWLPGSFGSFAATPPNPGWAFATWLYLDQPSGGADVTRAKQFQIGNVPANVTATVSGNTNTRLPVIFLNGSYAFKDPVLGGRASVSLTSFCGYNSTSLTAQIAGTISTAGGSIPFARADDISDSVTGCGDLFPQIAERWNDRYSNYLVYLTGAIPVGAYDSKRLANLGIGHAALDAGIGYTYLNEDRGHELSAVLGFTYNYENSSTNYRNGNDMHLDWGASLLVTESKRTQVGLVGYWYQQLGCDSGSGDHVGCFKSRVAAVGPQIGYMFPIGQWQGYLNLKAYGEFAAQNRAYGNNVWLTFAISPGK